MIEIGDKVWVRYSEAETDYSGIVRHVPNDVGDMWYIETEQEIIAVNPSSHALIGIYKTK